MRKTKAATLAVMLVNIVLLVVLLVTLVQIAAAPSASGGAVAASSAVPAAPQAQGTAPAQPGAMGGAGEDELATWIDGMKTLADKHNVSAYFLQELFPGQIVYKFRGETIYAEVDDTLPRHSYSWEHLAESENGTLSYAQPGGPTGIFGIDVSKHQGTIDWQKVKDAGVQYVIIRVGYRGYDTGAIKLDEYFEEYMEGASAVGLPIGVYFFSQAVSTAEAEEEAAFVLDAIATYNITWPVVFDMEEVDATGHRTENMTAPLATDIAIAFCEQVRAAGHTPMVYGSVSWFLSMTEPHRLGNYDKWFAQYRPLPWYPYAFTIWQYSNTGVVNGIPGKVDMNLSFVDYGA